MQTLVVFFFCPSVKLSIFLTALLRLQRWKERAKVRTQPQTIPANLFEERSFSGSWETRHLPDPEGRKKISKIRFSLQLRDE